VGSCRSSQLPEGTTTEQVSSVNLELVLCVGVSSSMSEAEQRLQREGYVNALLDAAVLRSCDGAEGSTRPSLISCSSRLRFNSRNPSKQKRHPQTLAPNAASAASFNPESFK